MLRRASLVLLLALVSACAREKPAYRYEFIVRVESDPGRLLSGAVISHAGLRVGASGSQGIVKLSARGKEGETMSFQVECPAGHKSPTRPLSVVLRKVSDHERHPEYTVGCPPTTRSVVVAVRANNGAGLPVRYLGREVARTDRSGAAHVLLRVAPDDALELTLDTSQNPDLSPKNPVARFQTGRQDEIFVFNQAFVSKKPKIVARRPRKKPPSGPIKL